MICPICDKEFNFEKLKSKLICHDKLHYFFMYTSEDYSLIMYNKIVISACQIENKTDFKHAYQFSASKHIYSYPFFIPITQIKHYINKILSIKAFL